MSICQRWLLTLLLMQCMMKLHACPSSCKCMWKGGKQTVECINEKLISIPDGVDPGTQVLEFSDNNLQVLPRERFQRIGLLNLQRIYLSRCRISQIDDRAFKGLSNLVELDLSQNLLNSVPTETFSDYPSLMRLTFNGNPIQRVKAESFKYLIFLTTLELSNCQIEVIEPDGFKGLVNLEWLKLDGNRLSNIQGAKTLPDTLHGIFLHHNPWQCDCRLMDLYFWLVNYNVPHPMEPKCASPARVHGETIKSLELDDLACLPDVSPTTLYLEIAEGKNVSLICRVSAIPEARISWWFQGRILQNDSMVAPGIHLYYFVEEGSEDKRSELFIFNTNTDDNGTFVCMAENPAGKSHSNYTIRIVMKEVPVIGSSTFSYEYVVTVSVTSSVIVLLTALCSVLCVVRCQRSRQRRRKKEHSKSMALQQQQHLPLTKTVDNGAGEITRLGADYSLTRTKVNGDLSCSTGDNAFSDGDEGRVRNASADAGPAGCIHDDAERSGTYSSPSLRGCSLDRNPDLINDTESTSKERRPIVKTADDDCSVNGERDHSGNNSYQEAMENIIHDYDAHGLKYGSTSHVRSSWQDEPAYPLHVSTLPRGLHGETYQQHHTVDVHLSPGRFLDSDGYPIDYGLPKLPTLLPLSSTLAGGHSAVFYRTLPHNRPSRLMMAAPSVAAVPASFAHEVEILPSSAQSQTYEHYSPSDIRYTVEGYPCSQTQNVCSGNSQGSIPDISYLPSPPAAYKGEVTISPVTVGTAPEGDNEQPQGASMSLVAAVDSWSARLNNLSARESEGSSHSSQATGHEGGGGEDGGGAAEAACCLESQTTREMPLAAENSGRTAQADSPDEGYEGDAVEGTDM